jgi:XTP/dITP diphosphohydrolase
MELLLATSNAHKAEEFNQLFDPVKVRIIPAPHKLEVEETGLTYFENALIKAQAYYQEFKRPILADDSGLNVEALPEELGIYSARFGGSGLSDFDRAQLLLKKMDGVTHREAYFTCVLCAYLSPDEIYYFEGRLAGVIGHEYRGTTGFGYDPVFIPLEKQNEGLTVAELHEWKSKNSHRAVASGFLEKFIATRK